MAVQDKDIKTKETKTSAKKTTKKAEPKTENNDNKLKIENDDLRKKVEDMQKMLLQLTQQMNQATLPKETEVETFEEEPEYSDDIDIRPDKQIRVISLQNHLMVLSTEELGQGKKYEFNKFGQIRNIPYRDLSSILVAYQSFAEDGRFYILNKDVIVKEGLYEHYKNLLTKEQIDNFLDYDKKAIEQMFNKTSQAQRDTIVSIIMDKIYKGEDLDLNKVDLVSKLFGRSITGIIDDYDFSSAEE